MLISIEFTSRSAGAANLQIRRKVQHSMSGLIICAIYEYFVTQWIAAVGTLVAASLGFFVFHLVRLRSPRANELFLKAFRPIMRPHEAHSLPGAFYFLLGCAISFAAFPKPLAVISVLNLSFGDPCASLFGALLGDSNRCKSGSSIPVDLVGCRCLPQKKSIAGLAAAFLACTAVTAVTVRHYRGPSWSGDCWERRAMMAIAGGLAGATAEIVPSGVDDNLSMPILSGACLYGIFACLWPEFEW